MTTVLFVGDSITVGLVGYPGKSDGSSFRRRAEDSLGWSPVGPFKDVNGLPHGGVGGSTTYTFLNGKAEFITEDSSWVLNYRPSICHVMLGVNDVISFNESPLDLFNRIHDLCSKAIWQMKTYMSNPIVYMSTICESLMPDQIIRAHALNGKIKSYKEIGSDYAIVGVDSAGPFNGALLALGSKSSVSAGLTVDGTHPTQKGYDLIAQGLISSVSPGTRKGSTLQKVAGIGLLLGGWYAARKMLG